MTESCGSDEGSTELGADDMVVAGVAAASPNEDVEGMELDDADEASVRERSAYW